MAKEYGFHFEFVTYNWTHWLRRQTQKQRVMWGYKVRPTGRRLHPRR